MKVEFGDGSNQVQNPDLALKRKCMYRAASQLTWLRVTRIIVQHPLNCYRWRDWADRQVNLSLTSSHINAAIYIAPFFRDKNMLRWILCVMSRVLLSHQKDDEDLWPLNLETQHSQNGCFQSFTEDRPLPSLPSITRKRAIYLGLQQE